ncbi:hypothetical protein DPMN_132197 [Dreissena polymorpha]|uniref:Uncharacterized protein n=1 Tax=Dreissena polymorpha TaxID=45954 RepID=A0A9D4FWB0_DREPO|nr:hypothetical protein DPMN_132197 [Dreissena polymorpha]
MREGDGDGEEKGMERGRDREREGENEEERLALLLKRTLQRYDNTATYVFPLNCAYGGRLLLYIFYRKEAYGIY